MISITESKLYTPIIIYRLFRLRQALKRLKIEVTVFRHKLSPIENHELGELLYGILFYRKLDKTISATKTYSHPNSNDIYFITTSSDIIVKQLRKVLKRNHTDAILLSIITSILDDIWKYSKRLKFKQKK